MQKSEQAIRLASLNEREQKSNHQETRIRTQHESIQNQLAEAWAEAKEKFGVTSLAEFRDKYGKTRDADNQALNEYENNIALREEIIQTILDSLDSLRQG